MNRQNAQFIDKTPNIKLHRQGTSRNVQNEYWDFLISNVSADYTEMEFQNRECMEIENKTIPVSDNEVRSRTALKFSKDEFEAKNEGRMRLPILVTAPGVKTSIHLNFTPFSFLINYA